MSKDLVATFKKERLAFIYHLSNTLIALTAVGSEKNKTIGNYSVAMEYCILMNIRRAPVDMVISINGFYYRLDDMSAQINRIGLDNVINCVYESLATMRRQSKGRNKSNITVVRNASI